MLFPSENLICCAACEAFDAGLYSLAATEDDGVTLIRKDAIKRAEIVDAEMGWEAFTALGKMAAIWDGAQEDEGRNVLRRRQILEWARINPADADRFLAACCIVRKAKGDDHVHFLEPAGHDKYILVGNPEELDRIEQHRAKSSAGGKASVESRKAKLGSADPRANREPREPNPEPPPEQPREPTAEVNVNTSALALASELESALASAEPGSGGHHGDAAPVDPGLGFPDSDAGRSRSRRRSDPKPPPSPSTPAGQVWESYRSAYVAKYRQEPVRNAKVNGQCALLVSRLGAEGAKQVVEFYLTHGGRWYVQCVHALGPCLKDAEALHTQMLAGYRVSQAESQRVDKSQGNAQAFAAVTAKLKAEGRL